MFPQDVLGVSTRKWQRFSFGTRGLLVPAELRALTYRAVGRGTHAIRVHLHRVFPPPKLLKRRAQVEVADSLSRVRDDSVLRHLEGKLHLATVEKMKRSGLELARRGSWRGWLLRSPSRSTGRSTGR